MKYHYDAMQRLAVARGLNLGEPLPLIQNRDHRFDAWLIESLHKGLGCAIVADAISDPYKRAQERKVALRCLLQAREYSAQVKVRDDLGCVLLRVGAGVPQSDALIVLQHAIEAWL